MEPRKLTKADLDKVRHIDGFPIGKDEDIIALSNAPYYTACPNPFIEEFIKEYGKPYNEETDDYYKAPFASDVSEGKNDAIYNAHTYHTKVPYKAIMRYILHYTNPGDIIFDGFCGTGMTGVAANMCGNPEKDFKLKLDYEMPNIKWGKRYPILNDLSPIAAFIAKNYTSKNDVVDFIDEAESILRDLAEKYEWMFLTKVDNSTMSLIDTEGIINYTVWSDVFICPSCGNEFVFYNVAVDENTGKVADSFTCPHCLASLRKKDCERAIYNYYDEGLNEVAEGIKQEAVLICYSYGRKKYFKKPDKYDLDKIKKINNIKIEKWYPKERMKDGKETRRNDKIGLTHVHHYFFKRTLLILSEFYDRIENSRNKDLLKIMFTSQIINISKMNRYRPQVSFPYNPLSGTMYVSSMISEANPFIAYNGKVKKFADALKNNIDNIAFISTGSTTKTNIPNDSCDYIFTDPPFGDNLNYSELSFIWETWLKIITKDENEAIVNVSYGKSLGKYQELMELCFKEYFRVLKPNRWITIEFHNSKNAVWNAIQEAVQKAGFIVADVRTLDKQGGSFKQVTAMNSVKQDLIISAYKPKNSFRNNIIKDAGLSETAWSFVAEHLSKVPVVVKHNNEIEILAERQDYLLFDRMVAYHIMQGIPVPIDASDFYNGLDEKFIKRDNMYFLSDQINEYDTARITTEVEAVEFSLFVTNEKTAISWLYQQLDDSHGGPKTYAELQPMFMQEVKSVDKYEAMPELQVMLEENFLQNEKGLWYVPDRTKAGDIAKLREKNLLKEFQGYMQTKGKLKSFRSEAIRLGFSKLWKEKNYKAIVDMAERIPEATLNEDDKLLMYYDVSLSRV